VLSGCHSRVRDADSKAHPKELAPLDLGQLLQCIINAALGYSFQHSVSVHTGSLQNG